MLSPYIYTISLFGLPLVGIGYACWREHVRLRGYKAERRILFNGGIDLREIRS